MTSAIAAVTVPQMVAASGALLDAIPIAILIHDHDGLPYYANRQARMLLTGNGDPHIPVGRLAAGVEIYVADTDIRYPLGRLAQVSAFSAGESRVGDMEIRRPGGTVHLEVWVKPTIGADGAVACVVHTFFDASERKNTDADLRLTESLSKAVATAPGFADVLETSLHEICQLTGWTFGQAWLPDDTGQRLRCRYSWHDDVPGLREFHEASREVELMLGEGLPGRVWLSQQWEWDDDATDEPAAVGAVFPSGHRASVAIPVVVAGDVVAVLEFFVLVGGSQDQRSLDRVGAVVSRVGLWMSTKGAEDAEDALEAQFRQIAESATDAIVSAGADNRIVYMNPSAERMFGYTADEVFGHSMTQLVHDRSDIEDGTDFGRYPQVGRGGLMGPAVYLAAVSKGGAEFPVEMNLTSWQQGNERFLTAIVRDASNRVDAEQRLEDALDREREVVEQLNVLDGLKYTVLQTLAHDLRSPIAAILTLTAILRVYSEPDANGAARATPDGRAKLLSDIERSVRKMERLLEDLINSDPLQPIEARRTRSDVGELISLVLAESDLGRNHPVHTDLQSIEVNVDAAQVERIVENLLNNADKHLDTGVPIWVTTTRPPDGGVLITVEDAGPGVSAATKKSIFEPFQRGDGRTSPGLGLGLSLVSRFAEIHGGRAWVEDRAGGGASFKVQLPDNEPVAKAGAPATLGILICDDDTIFGSALATLIGLTPGLELVGPPVMTGPEAVEGVARLAPDVVLMDVELLGAMNGFQATRLIREHSPATQVVIMSGAADLSRATKNAAAAGAASFLPKTEAVAKLLESVRAAARYGPAVA